MSIKDTLLKWAFKQVLGAYKNKPEKLQKLIDTLQGYLAEAEKLLAEQGGAK